jgi:hypothetical protein
MPRGIVRGERGPYRVYSDGSEQGDRAADLILERAERDFAQLRSWFGAIQPPYLPLLISCVPDPGGEPRSAAFHASCGAAEVEISNLQPEAAPFFAATQLIEALAAGSGGWSCLFTPGEALSQTLAFELYPEQAPRWNSEIIAWMKEGRIDFITHNGRDTNLAANGCGNLFLRWLRYQLGFEWSAIIQAGCQASCLGDVYQQLTGTRAATGMQRFQRLLATYLPDEEAASHLTYHSPFPAGDALCTLTILGLYDSTLGIPADPMALTYWTEQIRSRALSLEDLAEAFMRSSGLQRMRVITTYRRLLLRNPTSEELAACINTLCMPGGQEALWKHLLLSDEYAATHPSSGSFVRGIYQDILGIDPDVSALNVWVSALEAGSGRQAVIESFLVSPAALDTILNTTYARVLHRDPDPDTRAYYLTRMATGMLSCDDLLLTLLQSPQLRWRLARDFVSALFWSILDRAPNAAELEQWAAEIVEAGVSLSELTRALLESPEHLCRRIQEAAVVLLGRFMSEAEQQALMAVLQSGSLRIEHLWIELITSPEYIQRVGNGDNFITAVYRDVLGHKPDADELEHARAYLAKSEHKSFLHKLLTSEAYLSAYVAAGYRRFLGREPDPQTEVPLWVSALMNESSDLLKFEEALLNSNEFRYRAIKFRPI